MGCSEGVLGQDKSPRSGLCSRVALFSPLAEKHHGRDRSHCQAFSRVASCLRSHHWVFTFLNNTPHCPTQLCCGHQTCELAINESGRNQRRFQLNPGLLCTVLCSHQSCCSQPWPCLLSLPWHQQRKTLHFNDVTDRRTFQLRLRILCQNSSFLTIQIRTERSELKL